MSYGDPLIYAVALWLSVNSAVHYLLLSIVKTLEINQTHILTFNFVQTFGSCMFSIPNAMPMSQ
jgi:hypothetical protein